MMILGTLQFSLCDYCKLMGLIYIMVRTSSRFFGIERCDFEDSEGNRAEVEPSESSDSEHEKLNVKSGQPISKLCKARIS